MSSFDTAGLLHSLEGMTERAMSQAVQKSRDKRNFRFGFLEWLLLPIQFATNHFDQSPRGMEHADGVRETGMYCAGKGELGDSQLTDATRPLKFRRVDQIPCERIDQAGVVENDQSMNRIAKTFIHSHSFNFIDCRIIIPRSGVRQHRSRERAATTTQAFQERRRPTWIVEVGRLKRYP